MALVEIESCHPGNQGRDCFRRWLLRAYLPWLIKIPFTLHFWRSFFRPLLKIKNHLPKRVSYKDRSRQGRKGHSIHQSIKKNRQEENNQKLTWIPRETSFRSEFQSSDLENKSSKTRSLVTNLVQQKPKQAEFEFSQTWRPQRTLEESCSSRTTLVVQSLAQQTLENSHFCPLQTEEAAVLPIQRPHEAWSKHKALPKSNFGIDL